MQGTTYKLCAQLQPPPLSLVPSPPSPLPPPPFLLLFLLLLSVPSWPATESLCSCMPDNRTDAGTCCWRLLAGSLADPWTKPPDTYPSPIPQAAHLILLKQEDGLLPCSQPLRAAALYLCSVASGLRQSWPRGAATAAHPGMGTGQQGKSHLCSSASASAAARWAALRSEYIGAACQGGSPKEQEAHHT